MAIAPKDNNKLRIEEVKHVVLYVECSKKMLEMKCTTFSLHRSNQIPTKIHSRILGQS